MTNVPSDPGPPNMPAEDTPDPATVSTYGSNCARCGRWIPADDPDLVYDVMTAHRVEHFGPWS